MADGLQPRAQGILNSIGQMLPAGRQPSGAATYPFVPPERVPESLPAPLMGVSEAMPMAEPEPDYQPTPEEGADALVRLGNTSLKQAAARAKRATIPEREADLPPEEQRKDQGALKVLGGFLGNREAMAQLAIAFNSMRMRPDAGLAASMQKIVEQGGVRRQANRTAETLLARGMISPDQAEMIRMGMDYKDVMGSDAPDSFRALQLRAEAAGMTPGTPDYERFMRMGGAAKAGEPVRGVTIGDRLVNPVTGAVIADFGGEGPAIDQDQVKALGSLRDQLRKDVGDFDLVQQGYTRIEDFYNNPGAVSDYALAVAFAKILDPGSVAREGEVAAVQKSGSITDALKSGLINAIQGKGVLPAAVRQEIAQLAQNNYVAELNRVGPIITRYESLATESNLPSQYLWMGGELTMPEPVKPVVVPEAAKQAGITQEMWDLATPEEKQEWSR